MGHARRMQSNRRRIIWEMTKEKYNEASNSRQHDELSSREGEISQDECAGLPAESCGYRRASGYNGSD